MRLGRTGGRAARAASVAIAVALIGGGGASASPCRQGDVLHFVDSHVRAVTLEPAWRVGEPDETVSGGMQGEAVCSAWLRARDPAWREGNRRDDGWIWLREKWSVRRLRDGYAVTLLSPTVAAP